MILQWGSAYIAWDPIQSRWVPVSQFAEQPKPNPIDQIRECYEAHEFRPTQPDEAHGMYAEGWLALLRFVKALEATHRSGFEAIDHLNILFPDSERPVAEAHKCALPVWPVHSWGGWICPDCRASWYHRGTEWWPQ